LNAPLNTAIQRLLGLDIFRGLLLLIMVSNHTPSPIRAYTNQPLGFVSAAEAFVFVSAFLCGLIFSRKLAVHGLPEVKRLARRRAGQIYLYHVLALLFCFAVIGLLLGHQKPFFNMIHTYLDQPTVAAISALLLLYQPPLLDILPMYLVFLLLTPLILKTAMRNGWLPILASSALLWLVSQFGLKEWLVSCVDRDWLVINLGAFNLLSWQLLWIGGLLLGHGMQRNPAGLESLLSRCPRSLVLGLAIFFFCWRWPWIPISVELGGHYWLLDKWRLGPLRLLNFAVLVYLVLWLSPYINKILGYFKPLALLGRHMLPLFSLHVCFSLLAIGFVEIYALADPWCYLILSLHLGLIICVSLWLERRSETPPGNSAAAPPLYS
jgi:hypothetical protein